jgi:hypothetical protein
MATTTLTTRPCPGIIIITPPPPHAGVGPVDIHLAFEGVGAAPFVDDGQIPRRRRGRDDRIGEVCQR